MKKPSPLSNEWKWPGNANNKHSKASETRLANTHEQYQRDTNEEARKALGWGLLDERRIREIERD